MNTNHAELWSLVAEALELRDESLLFETVDTYRPVQGERAGSGSGSESASEIALGGSEDGRWYLIRDLQRELRPERDDRDWSPIRAHRTGPGIQTVEMLMTHGLFVDEVVVEFDSRVPFRLLQQELQRVWPEFIDRGWVRRTRALGERAVALLRFVCLEQPKESTWRDRMAAWNERYPDWSYTSSQAFHSAFRRAEEQLCGEPYGLEYFYNPLVGLSMRELRDRARAGDRAVQEYWGRRMARTTAWTQAMDALIEAEEREIAAPADGVSEAE